MMYRNAVLVECKNDEELARRVLSFLGLKFKIRHRGNKAEILKDFTEDKVSESIVFIDLDEPSDWPRTYNFIINNKISISNLKSTYLYVDNSRKVIIVLFDKNLEEWLISNCSLNSSLWGKLHRSIKEFRKYLDEEKCQRVINELANSISNHLKQLSIA